MAFLQFRRTRLWRRGEARLGALWCLLFTRSLRSREWQRSRVSRGQPSARRKRGCLTQARPDGPAIDGEGYHGGQGAMRKQKTTNSMEDAGLEEKRGEAMPASKGTRSGGQWEREGEPGNPLLVRARTTFPRFNKGCTWSAPLSRCWAAFPGGKVDFAPAPVRAGPGCGLRVAGGGAGSSFRRKVKAAPVISKHGPLS